MSLVGRVLYLAFAAAFIASALEIVPLAHEAGPVMLGGIAGAYTWGRHARSRWAGFGIGLPVTFLAIGFAIYARHAMA